MKHEFFFRVPKSENFEGKEILGELNQTYAAGFKNTQDIEWSFEKLDVTDDVTQSACIVSNQSVMIICITLLGYLALRERGL